MPDALISIGEVGGLIQEHAPLAIHHNDVTTFGFVGPKTYSYVAQYVHATNAVVGPVLITTRDTDGFSQTPDVDDHSTPTITRASDGTFHVITGSRSDSADPGRGRLVHLTSDAADSIARWTEEIDPTTDIGAYSTQVWVGSTLYLFYREGIDANRELKYVKYNGTSWSSPVVIWLSGDGDKWPYPRGAVTDGRYVYVLFNPRENGGGWHDPSVFRMDTQNSDALESVFGTSLTTPISHAEWETHVRIENTGSGAATTSTSFVGDLDENGKLHMAYCKDATVNQITYVDCTGPSFSISNIATSTDFPTGVAISVMSSTDILICFRDTLPNWKVYSGPASWAEEATLNVSSLSTSVEAVHNAAASLRFLFYELDRADFVNADLNVYGWGDSGFVTVSAPTYSGTAVSVTVDRTEFTGGHDKAVLCLRPDNTWPAAFWSTVKSDGSDIRVYQKDGVTPVHRHVESGFDKSGQSGVVWIRCNNVLNAASSEDEVFIVKVDGTSTEPLSTDPLHGRQGVWEAFDSVYTMDDDPTTGALVDATGNANMAFLTSMGAEDSVDGAIGKGIEFEASKSEGAFVNTTHMANTSQPYTLTMAMTPTNVAAGNSNGLIFIGDKDVADMRTWLRYAEAGTDFFVQGSATTDFVSRSEGVIAPVDGTDYVLHGTIDGSGFSEVFRDGVEEDSDINSDGTFSPGPFDRLAIGYIASSSPSAYVNSIISHASFRSGAIDDTLVALEAKSIQQPNVLFTITDVSASTAPTLSLATAVNITANSIDPRVTITF